MHHWAPEETLSVTKSNESCADVSGNFDCPGEIIAYNHFGGPAESIL